MSNDLGIANVTEALRSLVEASASVAVGGALAVVGKPPTVPSSDARVYVYLYQVSENAARRNASMPERRGDTSLASRPALPVDLRYLLCFQGDDSQHVPQRMLGRVLTTLHAEPLLGRDRLRAAALVLPPALGTPARLSTLPDDPEPVRLTPDPLDFEALSKIWSVFVQTAHLLCVGYRAGVVLLEAETNVAPALAVATREVLVAPVTAPKITGLAAEDGGALRYGAVLVVTGTDLSGESTRLALSDSRVTPAVGDITATLIRVPLPATLRAGPVPVQVVRTVLLGVPPTERPWAASNLCAFLMRPVVRTTGAVADVAVAGTLLSVEVDPVVGPGQEVTLNLAELEGSLSFSIPAAARELDTNAPSFDVSAVPTGITWLVRVKVDGAESVLDGLPFNAPLWSS